jgi:hypothetical protein
MACDRLNGLLRVEDTRPVHKLGHKSSTPPDPDRKPRKTSRPEIVVQRQQLRLAVEAGSRIADQRVDKAA